jgi:serine/threonine protein kinase
MENNVIDKYELIEQIGEGAFGIVYKARNILFNKIIALKIIKGASEEELQSFLKEIRKMDKLSPPHLNVMRIISADIKNSLLLIEMEYFEGKTLLKLLKEKRVIEDEIIVEYLKQILDGLSFIHSKRLVHRDIKPDNILLNKDCSLVKISDFGISKDLDYSSSDSIQGAFLYMSPEQLTNPNGVDHRSDFYSLAILMFQLKTGLIPFYGSITSIIDGKRFNNIPKTKTFLDPIIQKASKKNPNDRYQSAEEFKHALEIAYQKSTKPKIPIALWALAILSISVILFTWGPNDNKKDNNLLKSYETDRPKSDTIQTFETITLGDQIWMTENLGTKVFRNGDSIREAKNKDEWDLLCKEKKPAYCHAYNDPSNDEKYGLLYNWYAVSDSICPYGFEIPDKLDFDLLMSNYSYSEIVNNFNIIFSGWRGDDGYYRDFNSGMFLWSKEENKSLKGCIYTLKVFKSDNDGVIKLGEQKPTDGYSIRCIKKR